MASDPAAGAAALLALAHELVEVRRQLEMAKYQLGHERKRTGECTWQHAPSARPVEPMPG